MLITALKYTHLMAQMIPVWTWFGDQTEATEIRSTTPNRPFLLLVSNGLTARWWFFHTTELVHFWGELMVWKVHHLLWTCPVCPISELRFSQRNRHNCVLSMVFNVVFNVVPLARKDQWALNSGRTFLGPSDDIMTSKIHGTGFIVRCFSLVKHPSGFVWKCWVNLPKQIAI